MAHWSPVTSLTTAAWRRVAKYLNLFKCLWKGPTNGIYWGNRQVIPSPAAPSKSLLSSPPISSLPHLSPHHSSPVHLIHGFISPPSGFFWMFPVQLFPSISCPPVDPPLCLCLSPFPLFSSQARSIPKVLLSNRFVRKCFTEIREQQILIKQKKAKDKSKKVQANQKSEDKGR